MIRVDWRLRRRNLLPIMDFEQIYKTALAEIRADKSLLANYTGGLTQFPRHRLIVALYDDLQEQDYDLVRALFLEEMQLRKTVDVNLGWHDNYDVDLFYLVAFLLSEFRRTDDFWLFAESKFIDFDSGAGFDIEHLLSFGINNVYQLLKENTHHPLYPKVVGLLGTSPEEAWIRNCDIAQWRDGKRAYFGNPFPVEDPVSFAISNNEVHFLRAWLSKWAGEMTTWTKDDLDRLIHVARMVGHTQLYIKGLRLFLEKFPEADKYGSKAEKLAEIDFSFWKNRSVFNKISLSFKPELRIRSPFDIAFSGLKSLINEFMRELKPLIPLLQQLDDNTSPEDVSEMMELIRRIGYASNTNGYFYFFLPIVSHVLYFRPALESDLLEQIVGPVFANGASEAREIMTRIAGGTKFMLKENKFAVTPEGQFWVKYMLPEMQSSVEREIARCWKDLE